MKKLLTVLLSILILTCLVSCASKDNENKNKANFQSLADFDGARFAILTGSVYDAAIHSNFPNSEVGYYSTYSDCATAVAEGRADAMMGDTIKAKEVCRNNPLLTYFAETIDSNDYGYALAKNDRGNNLTKELNEYIKQIDASGFLQETITRWIVNEQPQIADYRSLENINGEIIMAVDSTCYPFTYTYEGETVGFDIDLITSFCKEKGYSLRLDIYDFAGMISAVSAGKADLAGSSIMITKERAEKMNFTTPFLKGTGSVIFRKSDSSSKYNNFFELAGSRIACLEGGVGDIYAKNNIKDIQTDYYSSVSDMLVAIQQGKDAAAVISSTTIDCLIASGMPLKKVGNIYSESYAYMFSKDNLNETLESQINSFIIENKNNGLIDEWYEKWCDVNSDELIDYDSLQEVNGVVKAAVCSVVGEPHCYYKENQIVGFDLEILYQFAKEYGYKLEITDYTFAGMLAALASNKADIAGSSITITEERKIQNVFSEPYKTGYISTIVYNTGAEEIEISFLDDIKSSFERTFIKEDRYKLFISGIDSTINITLLSVIFGTILGFLLFMLYRLNNRFIDFVLKIYTWLINGMPTVVLLMIFFYIIFSSSSMQSKTIAIIAFTFIFSVSVFGLLRLCFAGISKSQYEAAYALGYSKLQTLFKIIIPQIAPIFLPSYRSEIVSLMKATSIVGYIAVQDLTKMSDIVRSRTYEAFFPIIASTILYFLIAEIFIVVINIANKKVDTKSRKNQDILKGVTVHD